MTEIFKTWILWLRSEKRKSKIENRKAIPPNMLARADRVIK